MTVGPQTLPVVYQTDGKTKDFEIPFLFDSASEVAVFLQAEAGGEVASLGYGVDFTVNSEGPTALVQTTTTLVGGQRLVLAPAPALIQGSDYRPYDALPAERVETDLDLRARIEQWLAMEVERATRAPIGEGQELILPPVKERANKLASYDDLGRPAVREPTVPVISYEPGDAVSVIGVGDGATNDFDAFDKAIDDSIANKTKKVHVPYPPGGEWYYVAGNFGSKQKDITWVVDPGASVDGPTDLMLEQNYIRGAGWWDPPVDVLTLEAPDEFLNHQYHVSFDSGIVSSGAEILLTHQRNDIFAAEGADQQFGAYYISTDGGVGDVWSGPIHFTTSSLYCNNPLNMAGEPDGQKFTQWRTGGINFEYEGFGRKFWIRFGHGRQSTLLRAGVAQYVPEDTKSTLYVLYQLTDGTLRFVRYGDTPPAGATFGRMTFEGHSDLGPVIHDHYFGTNGRLHLCALMTPYIGSQNRSPKYPVIIYCDNPAADIEDMVFKFGPQIPRGEADLVNFWEYSMTEELPGQYVIVMRGNEREFFQTPQRGDYHFWTEGDGISFVGFRRAGINLSRDREAMVRYGPDMLINMLHDTPGGRGNPAVVWKRRGGGFVSGPSVSGDSLFSNIRARFDPKSRADTFIQPLDTRAETLIPFTGARQNMDWIRSNGERIDLVATGYEADWPGNTVGITSAEFLTAGDVIVGEVRGREETLDVGGVNQTFTLGFDATHGSPGVTAYLSGSAQDLVIGGGTASGFAIDTALDVLTVQKSVSDTANPVDSVVIHQTGDKATFTLSTGQDVLNFSAAGVTLAEDDLELYQIENGETLWLHEQHVRLDTANGGMHFLHEMSGNDLFTGRMRTGWQRHVPYGAKHPVTGDYVAVCATDPVTVTAVGGKGAERAIIRAADMQRRHLLNFSPRKNIVVASGNTDEIASYASGIVTMPGRASCGTSLPPGKARVAIPRMLLDTVPGNDILDSQRCVQIGSFDEHVSIELVWRNGFLTFQVFKLRAGAGVKDSAQGRPLVKTEAIGTIENNGAFSIDPVNAVFGVMIEYDTDAEEVMIGGFKIPLHGPLTLTFGDYYQISEVPKTTNFRVDLDAITFEWLSETRRTPGPPITEAPPINLLADPRFAHDREFSGNRPPVQQPRALLSEWVIVDLGGCDGSLRRNTNSNEAANEGYGGSADFLKLTVSGAVRRPRSLATDEVRFALPLGKVDAITPGGYIFQAFMEDGLALGSPNAAALAGLPLRLYWYQDLGPRQQRAVKYFAIDIKRVERAEGLIWWRVQVPRVELRSRKIMIWPGSSAGLEFRVAEGYNCELNIRNPAFFPGDYPMESVFPGPNQEDATRRKLYQVKAVEKNRPMAFGTLIDGSNAEFVFDLPGMNDTPILSHTGNFAFEHNGSLYTGTPSLGPADQEHAVVTMRKTGAALTANEPVGLVGISAPTIEIEPDGAKTLHRMDVPFGREVWDDIAIDSVVHVDSGGSATSLTLNERVRLRPSGGLLEDRLYGNGETAWTPDVSLPNSLSAVSLFGFSDASGEEFLTAGDKWGWPSTPVDGVGTIVPNTAGGLTFGTGKEYNIGLNKRESLADLWTDTVWPGSEDARIKVVLGENRSDAALRFDARYKAPVINTEPETDAVWNAITTLPDANASGRRYLKWEINDTIIALIRAGIWDKLDVLYCLIAHDEQTAFINWKNPAAFTITKTNAPTFEAWRGVTADGSTSLLDTNYTPSTDAINMAQDNASLFTWIFSLDTSVGNGTIMGASGGGNVTRIRPDDGASEANYRLNDATNASTPILVPGSRGYHAIDRAAAGSFSAYATGAGGILRRTDLTRTSTGLSTTSVTVGAGAGSFGLCNIAWAGVGASLGEVGHKTLASIVEDHMIRVGAL